MTVKRRDTRKRVSQTGWVTLEGGFAARQCTVIDLSPTGAKILTDNPATVPQQFRLAFTRDTRSGQACEIAWRRGKTLGVRFV